MSSTPVEYSVCVLLYSLMSVFLAIDTSELTEAEITGCGSARARFRECLLF